MISATFDQAQRKDQDDAIEDIYLSGVEDGYDGLKPRQHSWEYLRGYGQGCHRKVADIKEQMRQLEEDARVLERRANGEPDWMDEIMQNNDEPWLAFDCMSEEF